MKKILLLLFLILPGLLLAQRLPTQTIILKDGSRLTGVVLSDSSDVIEIKLTNPQVVTVKKSQIVSYETFVNSTQTFSQSKGYYIHFTSNLLVGKNDWGNAYTMSFQLSNGYQLSNGLSLGIGTGIEHFGTTLVPLYSDIKFHPWNNRISPFIYFRSGYSFALDDQENIGYEYDYYYSGYDYQGGLILNPGIGLAMFTWNNAAVNIGVGYRYQKVTATYNNPWWGGTGIYNREIITHFNRFEIQLGIIFR